MVCARKPAGRVDGEAAARQMGLGRDWLEARLEEAGARLTDADRYVTQLADRFERAREPGQLDSRYTPNSGAS
jgi:hypothetical protein